MKIYLSGPMTGVPEMNRPAFHVAASRMRRAGHVVVNPAELPEGWTWERYMQRAMVDLVQCDAMAVMPGAWASRGARMEIVMALMTDKEIRNVGGWCGDVCDTDCSIALADSRGGK